VSDVRYRLRRLIAVLEISSDRRTVTVGLCAATGRRSTSDCWCIAHCPAAFSAAAPALHCCESEWISGCSYPLDTQAPRFGSHLELAYFVSFFSCPFRTFISFPILLLLSIFTTFSMSIYILMMKAESDAYSSLHAKIGLFYCCKKSVMWERCCHKLRLWGCSLLSPHGCGACGKPLYCFLLCVYVFGYTHITVLIPLLFLTIGVIRLRLFKFSGRKLINLQFKINSLSAN